MRYVTPYTFSTGIHFRHLTIHPVVMQASFTAPPLYTGKYLIYESLVPFEDMSCDEIRIHFEKVNEPGYDAYADEICLGCFICDYENANIWHWEGKSPGFTHAEFNDLAEFITNYEEPDYDDATYEQNTLTGISSIIPEPIEVFTICLNIFGKEKECPVIHWPKVFEVQIGGCFCCLMIDEEGKWIQRYGKLLNRDLKQDIIRQINRHYYN